MSHHHGSNGTTTLSPPVRNRFFYGKLMDVRHFTMEQLYFLEKLRLMNRLGVGSGVLCGLGVEVRSDRRVLVKPGVAIDYFGREIVVTNPYCLEHPLQPTDACGDPQGEVVADGTVTLCLAYHECDTDPTPVLVSDCDTKLDCLPSAVQERFRLLVHRGAPDRLPPTLSTAQCAAIFPHLPPDPFNRRATACETLGGPCAAPTADCVVLATITAKGDTLVVDECTYRTVVYSNEMLFELLLCLAARVDECCGKQPPVAVLPVVTAMWPPPGETLCPVPGVGAPHAPEWFKVFIDDPCLELSFSREMGQAELDDPHPWARLWMLVQPDPPYTELERFDLRLRSTHLAAAGATAIYEIVEIRDVLHKYVEAGLEMRFLVQLFADQGHDIHDTSGTLLDADFDGTKLDLNLLDDVWASAPA